MRIGIMGDTHGDLYSIKKAVAAAGPVDMWLHAGDFCRDALAISTITSVPVTSVAGNCDGRTETKPDEFIAVSGYRIWLTHGHRHNVKYSLEELRYWARYYESDIVVYGHTHRAEIISEPGLLLFNPGSAAMPRRGKGRTCGILELKSNREGILPSIISIP